MIIPQDTLRLIAKNFSSELLNAAGGKQSSIPFIANPLPQQNLVKEGEVFQVLVIGGSVCKNALVKKTNGKVTILESEQTTQPILHTKNIFLSFLKQQVRPQIKTLCINFAYPLSPLLQNGLLDGLLVRGSKENEFVGLVNKPIGTSIIKYYQKTQKRRLKVAIANDTICLLLSGLGTFSWENLACGIIGTGCNFALFTTNQEAVNLESSQFDKFIPSLEAREIDKSSQQVGNALFEKETAGAYLFKHFNLIIKMRNIDHPKLTSTHELTLTSMEGNSETATIAKNLIFYSAELIACQMAGILAFQKRKLTFVMEGSFFWESTLYHEHVKETLEKVFGIRPRIVKIDNSAILGGARLAFSSS